MDSTAPKTKTDNTNIFLLVGIILLGVVGGYIFYSQILSGSAVPVEVPNIPTNDSLSKFKDIQSFNFEVFGESKFRSLKPLGEVPVNPGLTGRPDIFAPF